jgi:hypothetical protein
VIPAIDCIDPQDRARAGLGAPFRRVSGGSAGCRRWPWAVRLGCWQCLLDGSSRDARPPATGWRGWSAPVTGHAGRPGSLPPWDQAV